MKPATEPRRLELIPIRSNLVRAILAAEMVSDITEGETNGGLQRIQFQLEPGGPLYNLILTKARDARPR
jgi:hypothetical protein